MKPDLHVRLVNGQFEDPCLHVKLLREKRALLFDLGDISPMSPAVLYTVSDAFVTHMHVDHFIGFDLLLRVILRRETPLTIFGPAGIIRAVEGRLKGYTWNLIEEYPAVINVFSFSGRRLTKAVFRARNRFRKESGGSTSCRGILLSDPRFTVKGLTVDHGTPCLAFSIEENYHINIDKDRLLRMGLDTGPWLTEFKKMLRENPSHRGTIMAGNARREFAELRDIALISRGQKITYVTDASPAEDNVARIIHFVRGSDMLFCEAYFLEKDRDKAISRSHLTAKTAGWIAREAGVKKLVLMHFSPRYSDNPEAVVNEAMEEFGK